jgi:YHS domain-containing protein
VRGLLLWFLRIVVIAIVLRALFRLIAAWQRPRAGRSPRPARERPGGTLVRDPQCGTYIPPSSALKLVTAGDTQYFCSEKCRDAYLAAPKNPASNQFAKRA